jgi:hypothetical protein
MEDTVVCKAIKALHSNVSEELTLLVRDPDENEVLQNLDDTVFSPFMEHFGLVLCFVVSIPQRTRC